MKQSTSNEAGLQTFLCATVHDTTILTLKTSHVATVVASMVKRSSRQTSIRGDMDSIPARVNMFFFSCEVCDGSHVTQY